MLWETVEAKPSPATSWSKGAGQPGMLQPDRTQIQCSCHLCRTLCAHHPGVKRANEMSERTKLKEGTE